MLNALYNTATPESLFFESNTLEYIDQCFYSSAHNNTVLLENTYLFNDDFEINTEEEAEAVSLCSIIYTKPLRPRKTSTGAKKTNSYAAGESESTLNCLHVYHKQISKYPPMNKKDEIALFSDYTKIKKQIYKIINSLPEEQKNPLLALGDNFYKNHETLLRLTFNVDSPSKEKLLDFYKQHKKIRDEIVVRNLRFVIKVSKSFWLDHDIETFKSIISAGNIGLFTAIDKYDPSRNIRFLSYAAHWIALEIRLELASDSLIKVPLWWQKMVHKMVKVCREVSSNEISVKELSRKAKVPERYVKKFSNGNKTIMVDKLTPSFAYVEMNDRTQYNGDHEDFEEKVAQNDIRERLQDFINTLPPKEQGIIRLLFGLSATNRAYNLRQIGNSYNLCSERIRQIKEKAIRTLRRNFRKIGYYSLKDIYY